MKTYWIVIHKPTMKACYGISMKTNKYESESKAKIDMNINSWETSDFALVQIKE